MNQDEQTKYMELQMIDQQLKMAQGQLDQLDQQIAEISMIFENLDEMKSVKKDEEILVPLVNGVFIKAKITDPKHMLVNVGAGSLVSKSNDELKALLEKQMTQLTNYKDNLMAMLQNFYNQAEKIEQGLHAPQEIQ